jgi:hypothetical protein
MNVLPIKQQVMKPSDFASYLWDSVLKNNESETVARNIMLILARTGNEWRSLSWNEYAEERKKDGNFSVKKNYWFDKVIDYCASPATAKLFSPEWKN